MRERIRLWLIGLLDALPLSIVNSEISAWQKDLKTHKAIGDGLRVVIASLEKQYRRKEAELDACQVELAARIRELRAALDEKSALDDQLRRRSAAVQETDARVVKQAAIRLLESLPVLVQEAACYATRKIAQDKTIPGSMGFGKNMRRDEACEWAGHWLREKKEKFRDSDLHLACELYYHLDHKE